MMGSLSKTEIMLATSVFRIILLSPSATRKKRKADNGSLYLSPFL